MDQKPIEPHLIECTSSQLNQSFEFLKTISLENATVLFDQFRGYHPFATAEDLMSYLRVYGFLPLWSPSIHVSGGEQIDSTKYADINGMPEIQSYVCGFLFSPTWERVLLIRKEKPAWQKNRLNGIGGKIEPGETALEAMTREFEEETGLAIPNTWEAFEIISGDDFIVNFFFTRSAFISDAISTTDEKVEEYLVTEIPYDQCIDNLRWLIPKALKMAKDPLIE